MIFKNFVLKWLKLESEKFSEFALVIDGESFRLQILWFHQIYSKSMHSDTV